ncbi:MAG: hypothetical protein HY830_07350, partial [Actinobacteria bacterium]|nr:hypothetical protein [Actinomycetota bacterium]
MPLTRSSHPAATARPGRDDSGAVAVLVAILISAVLLTVGALTVDLGSAWAERAGLRAVAESAALAAAAHLPEDPTQTPDEAAVVDAAVRVLCDEANRRPQWGDTTTACITGAATWAQGSDLSDGGVTLERSAEYPTISDRDRAPWVVLVVTPPVRVDFGLARAGGIDHVDVSTSAGARRGLPYSPDSPMALQEPGTVWAGSPYSPYYLTVKDLEDNHGVSFGRLCLRTLPRTNATSFPPLPTPTSGFTAGAWALDGSGTAVDKDSDGNGSPNLPNSNAESFTLVDAVLGEPGPVSVLPEQVSVYVGVGDAAHLATTEDVTQTAPGLWSIRFKTPDRRADPLYGPVPVWWVFDDGTTPSTSTTGLRLDYPAPTGSAAGDCDTLGTGRGVVDAEALDPADRSSEAVASGLLTRLVPYGSRPRAQLLPDRDESCDAAAVAGEAMPAAAGDPAPDGANCVFVRAGADLTAADLT